MSSRSQKSSLYGQRLREKQKVANNYGLRRDRQLRNYFIKARTKQGNVGINLLASLTLRIDNTLFSSGLVNTHSFARQLVSHRHVLVSEEREGVMKTQVVKSPSYQVKVGQVIHFRKKEMAENKHIKDNLKENRKVPDYLLFDKIKLTISYSRYPSAEEIEKLNKNIDSYLVTEWYNNKV